MRILSLLCIFSALFVSCSPTQQGALHTAQKSTLTLTPTPMQTPDPTPTSDVSVRLIIARIGVNAPIEEVGITQSGDLATPQAHPWDDVGWYNNGPLPGTEGSAVIDGHLDRPGGSPAVFRNLHYLKTGDTVEVVYVSGKLLSFQVLRVASYTPQAAPVQAIFGTTGGKYLNLITCAGTWIPAQHQTALRLVVYTVLKKGFR